MSTNTSPTMFSDSLRRREREREERIARSRQRNADYAARIAMGNQTRTQTNGWERGAREARESEWLTQWRATQREPVSQSKSKLKSQSPPAYKRSGSESVSAGAERQERDRVERGMHAREQRRVEMEREREEVGEDREDRGDWSPVVDHEDPLGDLGVREGESSRSDQHRAVGGGTVPWGEDYGWSDNSEVLPKYEK